MIREDITTVRLFYLIEKFLREHEKDYSKEEKEFIRRNFTWGCKRNVLVPDILRQIYDELDLLEPNFNIYQGFAKLIEEHFDINRNIVELGGGKLPSPLAKYLALHQKSGTITVYDDRLITTKTEVPNLILIKERLRKDQTLKNIDMLISFMPCDGTEVAINLPKVNNLDFMIGFCEGSCHKEMPSFVENDWEQEMMYEARKTVREGSLGVLEVSYMEKYNNPYPIIYNKRKCK